MATEIMVIGPSGSGKSTSMRNLDPKSTFVINVLGKNLPFKGAGKAYTAMTKDNPDGNVANTSDFKKIVAAIEYVSAKRPEVKTIVIDDLQHAMSLEYTRRIKESGFAKFQDILAGMSAIINAVKDARPDLNVFFMMHSETDYDANGNKITKAKTIGKAIDQYLTLESLFTIVLYTGTRRTDKGVDYFFTTQTDGTNTAKSPIDMFDHEIPNDLQYVIEKIDEYYN